ncbi:Gfo/Idh/MocA family protein [Halosimplex aquaticum]|uniref:Gfo/Idh/MocA family protein n=1 Tax=Halosimplex aquaticum TaxID=3026162 RepID=A0ABD5Y5L8_9EURY|nr:Gfo/Idh/MocA family oxidoreductase [Halosimplex aquaticum]
MTETHRAVQIGCGDRGQTHARALHDSDRFAVTAVCDLDEAAARETAEEFDVPTAYTDLDAALETEEPTHVTLVTPATIRRDVIADVLAHDPDSLLFEKPVAITHEEVVEIADLVAESDARVTVCHQHVYGEEVQALGAWIDDGRLGDVERLFGSTKGGLYEHGTHFLHKLNWLLDAEPESVRAHAEWSEHPLDDWHAAVEPTDVLLELAYPGGTRATLHLGPDAPDVPAQADTFWLEYRLDAVGTAGHSQFVLGSHASARYGADGGERIEVEGFDPDGRSTGRLYEVLADCLSGERENHPSDFASALAVHRVVEAALRSAEEERAVRVDEIA